MESIPNKDKKAIETKQVNENLQIKATDTHYDKMIMERLILMGIPRNLVLNNEFDYEKLVNYEPIVLSVYPEHEYFNINDPKNDRIYQTVDNEFMKRLIFPEKLDFLSKIDLEETDSYFKPILQDYIVKASESKPKEFFHCFGRIEEDPESKLNYESFYSILVFFEEIKLHKTNEEYFVPKALIIYSRNPYFLLHKYLLESIYNRSLSAQEFPIDCVILSFFSIIKNKSLNCAKIFRFENFFENFDYLIEKETFLPIMDFNIGPFFANFNFDQFILLAEYFITRWGILIYTDEVEKLYPFYFTFTNLIFPLNNTIEQKEYYQFCNSSTLFTIIKSPVACFFAVNGDLSEAEINEFVRVRGDKILAVNLKSYQIKIYECKSNEDEYENFELIENSENNNNDLNENVEFVYAKNNNTILRKIFDEVIEKRIPQEIRLTYMLSHLTLEVKKAAIEKKFDKNFFAYCLNDLEFLNLTNELRKQLFSLFIKFLTFHQPYTKFEILENNNIEIILEQEKFLNIFEDEKIKNFYSHFINTSTFCQICYRNQIHHLTVKNFIIINELVKIYSIDKQRIYFDFFRFSELEEREVKDEQSRKENSVAKGKKAIFCLSESKEIKVKFDDFHQVFLELIKKYKKEFQVIKLDKAPISSTFKADGVVYVILKYLFFNLEHYKLSKYQKDLSVIFKNLTRPSEKKLIKTPVSSDESENHKANRSNVEQDELNKNHSNSSLDSDNDFYDTGVIFLSKNRPNSFGYENNSNLNLNDSNLNNNNNIVYENRNEVINARKANSQLDLDFSNKFNLSLKLDSEGFYAKELIYTKKYESEILIIELLVFKNLTVTDNIKLSNPEEIITVCYILLLAITIFFKFSNPAFIKDSKKTNFEKFTEIYKKYLEKTKEFKNYCFLHSIIFEIIQYLELKENYEKDFLLNLQKSRIIPSLNITMSFQQRDLKNKNSKREADKNLNNLSNQNYSCLIEESYFEFSKFNKNRKSEVEKYYKDLNTLDEFSLICCEHDVNFNQEADVFKENLSLKSNNSLVCRGVANNSQCGFFVFIKDKSFNLIHPKFLLLFLIDKIIKNNSLTFFIDKFFADAKDEESFYNLLFYFQNYKLDIELIFTN